MKVPDHEAKAIKEHAPHLLDKHLIGLSTILICFNANDANERNGFSRGASYEWSSLYYALLWNDWDNLHFVDRLCFWIGKSFLY